MARLGNKREDRPTMTCSRSHLLRWDLQDVPWPSQHCGTGALASIYFFGLDDVPKTLARKYCWVTTYCHFSSARTSCWHSFMSSRFCFELEARSVEEKVSAAEFLLALSLFLWLKGSLQVFNPQLTSHSIWPSWVQGFFYYVPLTVRGICSSTYRTRDLQKKFLVVNAVLAGFDCHIGNFPSDLRSNTFLNPAKLAPELEDLGNLSQDSARY